MFAIKLGNYTHSLDASQWKKIPVYWILYYTFRVFIFFIFYNRKLLGHNVYAVHAYDLYNF